MVKSIWILTNYNLYESKRHFAKKLAEAITRKGIDVRVYEMEQFVSARMTPGTPQPDLLLSFNRTIPDKNGQFFWDKMRIPYLNVLVDPAINDMNLTQSPFGIVSCVDHFDCAYMRERHFDRVFFWGHGVEADLAPESNQERPYDVVFIGSCYDAGTLWSEWQVRYPETYRTLLERASEITLKEAATPFFHAVDRVVQEMQLQLSPKQYQDACYHVDQYVRGVDRERLIRSIKQARVHVFGGTCWRTGMVRGWAQCLADCPNVSFYPAFSFDETLEILKKSKICLNSMPFFKNGTHERIFTGAACGALVVTNDNLWVREQFRDGEQLLLFKSQGDATLNDRINAFLADEPARQRTAESMRAAVMKSHTWDARVNELLIHLSDPPIFSLFS